MNFKFKSSIIVGTCLLSISSAAFSGFLIDEEKTSLPTPPQATTLAVASSLPVSSPVPVSPAVPVVRPVSLATPVHGVAISASTAISGTVIGEPLPLKVNVVTEGVPGNLGAPVMVPAHASLVAALNIVVPENWHMQIGQRVDRYMPSKDVDGGERKNWVDAVARSLAGTNILATVDWTKRELVLKAMYAPLPAVAAEKPKILLTLVSGKSLEAQVDRWAKLDGWTVRWDIVQDWVVSANASFGTDFHAAIKSLVETMVQNGVNLHADIYDGNNTVIIHQSK